MRIIDSKARTASGKFASSASVQRQLEYQDWLARLPAPERDDQEIDDSYTAFMKQRRAITEAERWQKRKRQAKEDTKNDTLTRYEQVKHDFQTWCDSEQQHRQGDEIDWLEFKQGASSGAQA